MKITEIELAGTSKTTLRDGTPGLPHAFARISHKINAEQIIIEYLQPSYQLSRHVNVGDTDDMMAAAVELQRALDGYEGTNDDIDGYFRAIQMLAD